MLTGPWRAVSILCCAATAAHVDAPEDSILLALSTSSAIIVVGTTLNNFLRLPLTQTFLSWTSAKTLLNTCNIVIDKQFVFHVQKVVIHTGLCSFDSDPYVLDRIFSPDKSQDESR